MRGFDHEARLILSRTAGTGAFASAGLARLAPVYAYLIAVRIILMASRLFLAANGNMVAAGSTVTTTTMPAFFEISLVLATLAVIAGLQNLRYRAVLNKQILFENSTFFPLFLKRWNRHSLFLRPFPIMILILGLAASCMMYLFIPARIALPFMTVLLATLGALLALPAVIGIKPPGPSICAKTEFALAVLLVASHELGQNVTVPFAERPDAALIFLPPIIAIVVLASTLVLLLLVALPALISNGMSQKHRSPKSTGIIGKFIVYHTGSLWPVAVASLFPVLRLTRSWSIRELLVLAALLATAFCAHQYIQLSWHCARVFDSPFPAKMPIKRLLVPLLAICLAHLIPAVLCTFLPG